MIDFPPIAIVGTACRFPGDADSPQQLWQNLTEGKDSIGPVPDDRWPTGFFDLSGPETTAFAKVGGFVNGIFDFDPVFFGISPREADSIDPQQRMLLELAHRSMEDACVDNRSLSECRTGVFVGIINHDYARLLLSNTMHISAHTGLGRSGSIAANRISYVFNLTGPSIAIDTACSSSLVAVDAACRSLNHDECDVALAGGVNAVLLPESYLEFGRAQMLSVSGRCRAFDAKADGFVRAEGGGLILLKRLSDALADRDRIRAIIAATAVNQDGRTAGIMSPSIDAQVCMMRKALQRADLQPSAIGYVEAHGTGTQSGDTAEAESIGTAYGRSARHRTLPVGSVKTNIGHTESAAGIAGLIKAQLSIEHNAIVPNLHFGTPNPAIDFNGLGLRVPSKVELRDGGTDRLRAAAVNSFGFGGTNAHVILRQAPAPQINRKNKSAAYVLPVAAPSEELLENRISSISELAQSSTPIQNIYSSAARQHGGRYRKTVLIQEEAADHIDSRVDFSNTPAALEELGEPPHLCFVFSGIGRNWGSAGRQLYSCEPQFKSAIDDCDALFRQQFDNSIIRGVLERGKSPESVIRDLHPLLFAIQIGLYQLWHSWHIVPQSVLGHSIGEAAAAWASGALTMPEAVQIIGERYHAFEPLEHQGKMLAAALDEQTAADMARAFSGELHLASVNSPASITFSGSKQAIEAVGKQLHAAGTRHRMLDINVPFHCPLIESVQGDALQAIDRSGERQQDIRWFSSFGKHIAGDIVPTGEFWWQNFSAPANFQHAFEQTHSAGCRTFVEISPIPALLTAIHENLDALKFKATVLPSLMPHACERTSMLRSAGRLFELGSEPAWPRLCPLSTPCNLAPLHFERRTYAKQAPQLNHRKQNAFTSKIAAIYDESSGCRSYRFDIEKSHWLKSHTLHGKIVFPAAGFIAVILDTLNERWLQATMQVSKIGFHRLLEVAESKSHTQVRVLICENSLDSGLELSIADADEPELTCATATADCALPPDISIRSEESFDSCTIPLAPDEIAASMERAGFAATDLGIPFNETYHDGSRLLKARIEFDDSKQDHADRLTLDPAKLDAVLRIAGAAFLRGDPFMPISIGKIWIASCELGSFNCHARKSSEMDSRIHLDLDLMSDDGDTIAQIREFAIKQTSTPTAVRDFQVRTLVRVSKTIEPAGTTPQIHSENYLAQLQTCIGELSKKHQREQYYSKVRPVLDRLTLYHTAKSLQRLKVDLSSASEFSIFDCALERGITGLQRDILQGLINLLAEHGVIEIVSERCRVLKEIDTNHPPLAGEDFFARSENAGYIYEYLLANQCGRLLPGVLQGKIQGNEVLFDKAGLQLLENLYSRSPTCRIYNEILAESIKLALRGWELARPMRILELGGGTGALLARIEPFLTSSAQYVFTDISSHFVSKAKERYKTLENLEFKTLDFDASPHIQGFKHGSFDLVVATDALHCARFLDATLKAIWKLLRPGGMLHFVELTDEPSWARISFAMLPGWQQDIDDDRRVDSPCRTSLQWRMLLESNGFSLSAAYGDREDSGESLHTVFIAQKVQNDQVEPSKIVTEQNRRHWLIFQHSDMDMQKLIASQSHDQFAWVGSAPSFTASDQSYQIDTQCPEHYLLMLQDLDRKGCAPDAALFLAPDLDYCDENQPIDLDRSIACAMMPVRLLQTLDRQPGSLRHVVFARMQIGDPSSEQAAYAHCFDSIVSGLLRSARSEYPSIKFHAVSIQRGKNVMKQIVDSISSKDAGFEVSVAGGKITTMRLEPARVSASQLSEPFIAALRLSKGKGLERIKFIVTPRPALADKQIRISVAAASLNFRDIMVALDALPEHSVISGRAGRTLGIECAGTVIECGKSVSRFSPGDQVAALVAGSLATSVVAEENFCVRLPDSLSFEYAAAWPAAYITAHLCLREFPVSDKPLNVLVHTASGGVGLALVGMLCKCDTRIYCTAGSEAKRAFLQNYVHCETFDSRSSSFAEEILTQTDGAGIHVLINTLGTSAAKANSRVLADGGTFIELGKYAGANDAKQLILDAKPKIRHVTVDLDARWQSHPADIEDALNQAIAHIQSDQHRALPFTAFPASNAARAFKHLAAAKQIGKVIVDFDCDLGSIERIELDKSYYSNGSWLIAGGTRGFGMATALWLARRGAKSMLLIGRSEHVHQELSKARDELHERGASISVASVDITDLADLQKCVQEFEMKNPPIRFVLQCAMQIEDRMISKLSGDTLSKVLKPKVIGTWNLHKVTSDRMLQKFVVYSSVTSLIGPAGQSAYTAANSFQDSFAVYLRKVGIPAVSVNWGAVSDYGYISDHPESDLAVGTHGIEPTTAESLLEKLPDILVKTASPCIAVASGPWAENAWLPDAYFDAERRPGVGRRDEIGRSDGDGLANKIESCIARVLELGSDSIDRKRPIVDYGMDSLLAVELAHLIEVECDITITPYQLIDQTTIEQIAKIGANQNP